MSTALDEFIPNPKFRDRHEIMIHAPSDLVMQTARTFDIQSVRTIHLIFWLREKLLGARATPDRQHVGLISEMLGLGWGRLREEPDRLFVAGAACQPWMADVVFSAIPPERFASHSKPDCVKIAWTLESEPLGPALTRFATETRVAPTDAEAHEKFSRYWRVFRIGIVTIRRLLLPAIRREAEKQWRLEST